MGKKLEPDENGRLPLSPKTQEAYDHLKSLMGASWWHWEGLMQLSKENNGTFTTRIHQMVDRGWLQKKAEVYEPTGRVRQFFRLVDDQIMMFCAGCDQWVLGHGHYLCEECRA